jgi:enterochelin esterase-like enzyme
MNRWLGLVVVWVCGVAGAQVVEPVVGLDHGVTFTFSAPKAAKVGLALEGVKDPLPMAKSAGGVWTLTVPGLKPELYYYHFEVDGESRLDPGNFGINFATNAVANSFLVPGDKPEPWETQDVPHGAVHRHRYTSKVVVGYPAGQSEFYVYTPSGYDPAGKTVYPVLYLLHGWSQVAEDWSGFGRANESLDALIAQGKAKPMVVVMPSGYGDRGFLRDFGVWREPAMVDRNTGLFGAALLGEVMPQVDRMYRVSGRREDRAIVGLSMGGLESLTVGLEHPELFAWVGGMSSAVHLMDAKAEAAKVDAKKADFKLVWIGCGTGDNLIGANQKLVAALEGAGVRVTTDDIPGGFHTWLVWRQNLVEFASLAFQNASLALQKK